MMDHATDGGRVGSTSHQPPSRNTEHGIEIEVVERQHRR
jgi:hypothetical protein